MTKKEMKIREKMKALDRLTGMFKVNGANRRTQVKGFRFVLKSF